jgi:hypothetical protein
MDIITIIAVAVLTEALIEYAKTVAESFETKDYKTFWTQVVSVILGITMSFSFGINAFATGFTVNPVIGTAITGIIISRGSNYASDLIGKLTK